MTLPQPFEPEHTEPVAPPGPPPGPPPAQVSMKVAGVMSMPELAHTCNMFSVMRAFALHGITVYRGSGCWWEQSLSRILYDIVAKQYDYVVTVDYDSVFDPHHVIRLLQLAATFPDVSAIFAMQYRRNVDEILCAAKSDNGPLGGVQPASIFDRELTEAHIGHFGLTIIKVADLARLPHPWFWSQPNEYGKWETGKVDADIHFWRLMGTHKMRVCQANKIKIGHSQKIITAPDSRMQPMHIYHPQWDSLGTLDKAIEYEEAMREAKAYADAQRKAEAQKHPQS